MDIQLLPAPIAYVRHLVDVEEDDRAKFDQWRVLAQNMLQLMAAILINDCFRLNLIEHLATPPLGKRLVIGDFIAFIIEAAAALVPQMESSYVPELVQQYGENGKETRQRRTRLERIVVNRNRDAHTPSLAQTNERLLELGSDVDEVLEELDFLRAYTLVAAKNVELTPDRNRSQLNGVRCHGISDRYVSIQLPIAWTVSRGELILVKVDSSEWLSLRPWFLYSLDHHGKGPVSAKEELTLLNRVNSRRLEYVGLVSGVDYQVDSSWKTYTVYDSGADAQAKKEESDGGSFGREALGGEAIPTEGLADGSVYAKLIGLSQCHENIVVNEDKGARSTDYMVSIRTPVRDVAVATVDFSGVVRVYPRMLYRAVADGLLGRDRLNESLRQLGAPWADEIKKGTGLLEIGNISERVEWLGSLASEFAK